MASTGNLAKRIRKLEQQSMLGQKIHYPKTDEELLEVLNEKYPVFVLNGRLFTAKTFVEHIRRHNKGIPVQEDGY